MAKEKVQKIDDFLSQVIGHQKQKQFIARALTSGRLAHAYIFFGPAQVGKTKFALELASVLLCQKRSGNTACGHCNACRIPIKSNHDLAVLDQEEEIGVEAIRRLQDIFGLATYGTAGRALIIPSAERLTPAAFNALLKFMEEPKTNTTIMLTTNTLGEIPATVRSRTQVVRFHTAGEAEILKVLLREKIAKAEAEQLTAIAQGSVGRALQLAQDPDELKKRQEYITWHRAMTSATPSVRLVRGEQLLKEKSDELPEFLSGWFEVATAQLQREPAISKRKTNLKIVQSILTAQSMIKLAINRRLLFTNLLLSF